MCTYTTRGTFCVSDCARCDERMTTRQLDIADRHEKRTRREMSASPRQGVPAVRMATRGSGKTAIAEPFVAGPVAYVWIDDVATPVEEAARILAVRS